MVKLKVKRISLSFALQMLTRFIGSIVFFELARKELKNFSRKRKFFFKDVMYMLLNMYKCSQQLAVNRYMAATHKPRKKKDKNRKKRNSKSKNARRRPNAKAQNGEVSLTEAQIARAKARIAKAKAQKAKVRAKAKAKKEKERAKALEVKKENKEQMSQQAFSKAREKIRWEACKELFTMMVNVIYSRGFSTWHKYRVIGVDGSKIQLPVDKHLREHYGTAGGGGTSPTAQSSILYDVMNHYILDAIIAPMKDDERTLAKQHLEALSKLHSFGKELILADRGYPSVEMIRFFMGYKVSYCIRVKTMFNTDIDLLPEGIHDFTLKDKAGSVDIRVVKFYLPSGELETLLTNVYDKRLGIKAFKKLYFMRWPIENAFRQEKRDLQIENFTGRTENAICQDYYLTVLIQNLIAVSANEAQPIIDAAREGKSNKYRYQVNFNYAVGVFKDDFLSIVLAEDEEERAYYLKHLQDCLLIYLTPIKPNRSADRKTKHPNRNHNINHKFNG